MTTPPPLSKIGPERPELLKDVGTGELVFSANCPGPCQLARQIPSTVCLVRFSTFPSLQSSKALCDLQASLAHLKHFWACNTHLCFCARKIPLQRVATQPSDYRRYMELHKDCIRNSNCLTAARTPRGCRRDPVSLL